MVLESKVREEKRERGVIIKKMERQTRLKVEPDPRSSDLIPYKTGISRSKIELLF